MDGDIASARGLLGPVFHGQGGKEMVLFTRMIRLSSRCLATGTHLAGSKAGSKTSHGSPAMIHFHWLPFINYPEPGAGATEMAAPQHTISQRTHIGLFSLGFFFF